MNGIITQQEAVERSRNEYESLSKSRPKLAGADCGIHDLNMAIGGHVRKKLTTIAGRSGMGKTACTIPIFKSSTRVVGDKIPAYLFLTWEMASEEVVSRYISHEAGLSYRALFHTPWVLSGGQKALIDKSYNESKDLLVVYQELSTNMSHIKELSNWFCDSCLKKEKTLGVEVVPVMVIDYIGMAKFEGSNDLRTYKIGEFMNSLKTLSKTNDQHTIALAQISRSSDSKDMPGRTDLADSQGIEMASDNLIILHRPEYLGNKTIDMGNNEFIPSEDKAIFRVVKGRNFGIGDMVVNCEARHSRFWSMDHDFGFEYWKMYDDIDFWKKMYL